MSATSDTPSPCRYTFFANFLRFVYQNEIQAVFQLQTLCTTYIIPSKDDESIKFDTEQLEKKLYIYYDGWSTRINWIIAIFEV